MVNYGITVLYHDSKLTIWNKVKVVVAIFVCGNRSELITIDVLYSRTILVDDAYGYVRDDRFIFVDDTIAVFVQPNLTRNSMLDEEAKVDVFVTEYRICTYISSKVKRLSRNIVCIRGSCWHFIKVSIKVAYLGVCAWNTLANPLGDVLIVLCRHYSRLEYCYTVFTVWQVNEAVLTVGICLCCKRRAICINCNVIILI